MLHSGCAAHPLDTPSIFCKYETIPSRTVFYLHNMKINIAIQLILGASMMLGLFACRTIPKGVVAVHNFDQARYLGKWYEIARFDFTFERNLNNTTANYALKPNGDIEVINRGYNTKTQRWQSVEGKAKFVQDPHVAMLKVSFFGPFYGGYNVIALDDDYQYALVAGPNLDYLWLLARATTIPADIKEKYLNIAQEYGFRTDKLLWVAHDAPTAG